MLVQSQLLFFCRMLNSVSFELLFAEFTVFCVVICMYVCTAFSTPFLLSLIAVQVIVNVTACNCSLCGNSIYVTFYIMLKSLRIMIFVYKHTHI